MVDSDRFADRHPDLLDDFQGQRVDQPGLPGGQLDRPSGRVRGELLPCLGGVLGVEFADLLGQESRTSRSPHSTTDAGNRRGRWLNPARS